MKTLAPPISFEKVTRELSAALLRYLRHLAGEETLADHLLEEALLPKTCRTRRRPSMNASSSTK